MKKRLFCLLMCLFTAFLSVTAFAEQKSATLTLNITETADSYILALLVSDTQFFGVQTDISYNPKAVVPDSDDLTEAFTSKTKAKNPDGTDSSLPLLTCIFTKCDNERGLISYAGMSNISQTVPNPLTDEKYEISVNDTIEIYEISFKKVSDADPEFAIAKAGDEVYNPSNPDGILVASNGNAIDVSLTVSFKEQEKVYRVNGKSAEKSYEQKRAERMNDMLILQIGNYAVCDKGALKWVDPQNKAVFPYIENDRTLVPLRFIAEQSGFEVEWDEAEQKITMTGNNTVLVMKIGSLEYTIDGTVYKTEASPTLKESRTFVPLRVISEAFGKSVTWIENCGCIVITSASNPWNTENEIESKLLQSSLMIMSSFIRDMV